MNQPHVEHGEHPAAEAAGTRPGAEPATGLRAVAGPFGLRDIVVGSAVLVMLVGSVLPFTIGSGRNLWTAFSLFYVGIGIIMPLVVAGLLTARRLAPSTRLRVGSLSLDQFASVIAVLAAVFFFLQIVYVFSVGSLLGLLGAAALLAATTFAPYIPPFAAEFSDRPEIPAHPVARDAKPLVRVPKPVPAPGPAGAEGDRRPVGAPKPGESAPGAPRTGQVHAQQAGTGRPETVSGNAAQSDGAAEARPAGAGARSESGQAGAGSGAAAAGAGKGPAGAAGAAGAGAAASATGTAGTAGTAAGGNSPAGREVPAGEDPLPATTVNPAVQGGAPASNTEAHESISATREENENVVEAFWFAVGTPRQIVDERTGLPLFMFYPGDWELGLEDRGHEFLVQDKRTGRIGVLRDLTNIERVSDDSSGH